MKFKITVNDHTKLRPLILSVDVTGKIMEFPVLLRGQKIKCAGHMLGKFPIDILDLPYDFSFTFPLIHVDLDFTLV